MPSIPGKIRDILFGSTTLRLNWTLESIMSLAACDDVHGVAIQLLSLDLAAGKFTPEMIDFNDEPPRSGLTVWVNSICFARPFLTNTLEHSSALMAHAPERSTAAAGFGPCRPRPSPAATAN